VGGKDRGKEERIAPRPVVRASGSGKLFENRKCGNHKIDLIKLSGEEELGKSDYEHVRRRSLITCRGPSEIVGNRLGQYSPAKNLTKNIAKGGSEERAV